MIEQKERDPENYTCGAYIGVFLRVFKIFRQLVNFNWIVFHKRDYLNNLPCSPLMVKPMSLGDNKPLAIFLPSVARHMTASQLCRLTAFQGLAKNN